MVLVSFTAASPVAMIPFVPASEAARMRPGGSSRRRPASFHGDFNDDLAALGPQAPAVRLGHGMM